MNLIKTYVCRQLFFAALMKDDRNLTIFLLSNLRLVSERSVSDRVAVIRSGPAAAAAETAELGFCC